MGWEYPDFNRSHEYDRIYRVRAYRRAALSALRRISPCRDEVREITKITLEFSGPRPPPDAERADTLCIEFPGITDYELRCALEPLVQSRIADLTKAAQDALRVDE